mmetsp:Transcript_21307/g.42297  ORF Transcript_21307/g.42297 Transcript_21307/m.42297 type:complete len:198 (+) Transcript_21307:701-1294(+)
MLGAGKDAMASDSAEYFLRLFLRSQRIYQDLTLATEYSSSEKTEFYQGFAVREWVDIDIGMEFRAFVCNNRFTQMCQYDYLVQVEMLLQDNSREQLKDQLIKFWEQQVHSTLSADESNRFHSYVVDLAVDVNGNTWVIELNPFQESTDGAMFSWAKERDLLSQGPLEFRVQTVPQNAMVCLDKKWRKVLTEMLDKGA